MFTLYSDLYPINLNVITINRLKRHHHQPTADKQYQQQTLIFFLLKNTIHVCALYYMGLFYIINVQTVYVSVSVKVAPIGIGIEIEMHIIFFYNKRYFIIYLLSKYV